MSEKKTLDKCKRIMEMFERQKSKHNSGLKLREKQTNINQTSSKKSFDQKINRLSYCLPSKKKNSTASKTSLKPSYNKSTSSVGSAQKSSHSHSKSKSGSKYNFSSIYNNESRYDRIMKLKVKPEIKKRENNKNSYLNASRISFQSSGSSIHSQSKQSRFDRIMKLKAEKPKVDSTLKNYKPVKEEKKVVQKENWTSVQRLELKKCKDTLKKEWKQADKEDRLWKVFQRERELRLKQKEKKERKMYEKQRSLQKRFDALVQKQLKKIQNQKQYQQRKQQAFSNYLFPSY